MTLRQTMNAITITRPGGPEVLQSVTRPVPQPGERQVLIEVAYAGINRHDCGQRNRGTPPPGATDIPGLEVAGVVAAVGASVSRSKVGDDACALVNGGGYAEYCLAEEPVTLPIPSGFDLKLAAALPEALLTAWLNVSMLGRLRHGEWLLVHGGSSGVGTMAIQLARLEGAHVITTVGNAAKAAACRKLGAMAINYREQDFVAEVMQATGKHGADVILDMAGTAYAKRNLEALAMDGRIVHLSGSGGEYSVPLTAIMAKRAVITGSLLRGSALSLKTEIVRQVMERVWPHLGTEVMPLIDSVFPLAGAADAHARMESSAHIGKILLEVRGPLRATPQTVSKTTGLTR
ncbi:MAG: NAD(P)H-quinone oxidoreductase [Rhodospirillaceae bacterium]